MTFREFDNAVRGCVDATTRVEQSAWERTRWQTALLLNAHTKKGHQLKPKDLAVFDWEKDTKKTNKVSRGFAQLKALANG
jgi:hypothetical protein